MDVKDITLTNRTPWALLLAAAVLAGSVGTGLWWLTRPVPPEPPFELVACDTPEAIVILEDSSPSVTELDPNDLRIAAVHGILRHLRADPCTPYDVTTVVSFTQHQVTTGPLPASDIATIGRARGDSTDIAAAVDVAITSLREYPSHRPIVIMLTDLEDGSNVPIDATMARLVGTEIVVVSIGQARAPGGVTRLDLDNVELLTRQIGDVINQSRSNA